MPSTVRAHAPLHVCRDENTDARNVQMRHCSTHSGHEELTAYVPLAWLHALSGVITLPSTDTHRAGGSQRANYSHKMLVKNTKRHARLMLGVLGVPACLNKARLDASFLFSITSIQFSLLFLVLNTRPGCVFATNSWCFYQDPHCSTPLLGQHPCSSHARLPQSPTSPAPATLPRPPAGPWPCRVTSPRDPHQPAPRRLRFALSSAAARLR